MKRFLKWTFWIVSVLLVIFFGIIVAGTLYARKVAPWPDPVPGVSLKPSRPFLAASNIGPDNAYFYFLKLTNYEASFSWDDDLQHEVACALTNGWVAESCTNITAWNATNQHLFQLFATPAAMTNSQSWTYAAPDDLISEITPFFKLSKLHVVLAAKAFSENQDRAAVSNIEMVLRNCSHFEKGNALIGRLVTFSADTSAMRLIRLESEAGHIDREANLELGRLIDWRDATREPMADAMRHEAIFGTVILKQIDQGRIPIPNNSCMDTKIPPGLGFMPALLGSHRAAMSNHLDTIYSHMICAADDSVELVKMEHLFDVTFGAPQTLTTFFDDPLIRIMGSLSVPSLTRAIEQGLNHHASLRAARVMLAVESWRADHDDKPPASLADLCPKYLAKIPEDPFAKGSNLLYRVDADSYTIYSVGKDGLDNSGDVQSGYNARDVGWHVRLDRNAANKR